MRADLGSYLEAFIISGLLCFLAAGIVLLIGRDRATPESAFATGRA
jgi:hypothetical protein